MDKNKNIRSEKSSSNQSAENALNEYKKRIGEVVHVAISARTTFEFPAYLSQEEIDIRIENYKKRHSLRLGGW